MRPPIEYQQIPESEPVTILDNGTSYSTSRRSEAQKNDQHYKDIKEYILNFYKYTEENTKLYWAPIDFCESEYPITIETLKVARHDCGCCGIIAETLKFTGDIFIDGKSYWYDCYISIDRWCEHEDRERNLSEEFLFKFLFEEGAPMQFLHLFTRLECLKYAVVAS